MGLSHLFNPLFSLFIGEARSARCNGGNVVGVTIHWRNVFFIGVVYLFNECSSSMRLARWKALSSLEVILRFAIRLRLGSLVLEVTLLGWVTLSGLERLSFLVGTFTGHVSLLVTLKTSAFFTIFPFIGFSEGFIDAGVVVLINIHWNGSVIRMNVSSTMSIVMLSRRWSGLPLRPSARGVEQCSFMCRFLLLPTCGSHPLIECGGCGGFFIHDVANKLPVKSFGE